MFDSPRLKQEKKMEYLAVIFFAALVFGLCFLVDKGFTKLFRSQAQHHSGQAVRLNKKYGAFGLILAVLGLATVFVGLSETWVFIAAGAIVIVVGIALVVYYMTFGIFYDTEGFVYTSFGKKSVVYPYNQIRCQQLYILQGGGIVVELHMTNGNTVQVQLQLKGAEDFLNTAFLGWVRQKNLDVRNGCCDFHDPEQSCWFPPMEEA